MAPTEIGEGRFRVGRVGEPVNLRMQVGLCSFASPDAALLVSLLPAMIVARGEPRLALLLQLVGDETRHRRAGRELVLERLLEVLLIEALRCGADVASVPSVARGLSDDRLAAALRAMHARPAHGWTVAELAREAGMSRSAFFARFSRVVGLPPMEYLLAWRMALAKRLLRTRELAIEQVAARIGYGSASTFSTAFARHVGMPLARYARDAIAA
jgi:transcriptional regulator GlxA family with amidase domain